MTSVGTCSQYGPEDDLELEQVWELQVHAVTHGVWSAGDQIQCFVNVGRAHCQLQHIPSSP